MASIVQRNKSFSVVYTIYDGEKKRQKWETYHSYEAALRRKEQLDLIQQHEKERAKYHKAKASGAAHVMVGNIGQIALAKESGLTVHGDFRLNLQNSYAASVFEDMEDLLLSPELLLPQMRDIPAKKSAIVYGRVPLMTLEKSCGTTQLIDRMKKAFPVIREGGRELVLNSLPIYMADKQDLLKPAHMGYHYVFTTEGPQEVKNVLSSYVRSLPTKKEVRRMK